MNPSDRDTQTPNKGPAQTNQPQQGQPEPPKQAKPPQAGQTQPPTPPSNVTPFPQNPAQKAGQTAQKPTPPPPKAEGSKAPKKEAPPRPKAAPRRQTPAQTPTEPMDKVPAGRLQRLKRRLSQRQRVALLIVAVVVVLGLLTATVFRENVSSFFRWMAYSQADSDFPHNAQANSLFLGMGDDLLIGTQSQIQIVSSTGASHLKQEVTMGTPALNASGDYAVVYGVGGQEAYLVSQQTILQKLELKNEETILCATVNEKGWMAVTSKASGYKAVVTVYNTEMEAVLTIRLSSRYVSDAVVTPDCRGVYLISPGQSGGAFENTLLYYTLSSREEPVKTLSLGSNVVLSIRSADRCWILGDTSLLTLDSSGVITASYEYQGQHLNMGTLQGDGYAALYLSPSASGSTGTLVTVGANGKPIGELDLEGQTLALAAQGDHLAMLTTSEVITADKELTKYTTFPNQQGLRTLAVYADGSVGLINSAAVSLHFPFDGTKVDAPEKEEATQTGEDQTSTQATNGNASGSDPNAAQGTTDQQATQEGAAQ